MYQASFKKELNRLYTIRWIAQNELKQEHISWMSKLELRSMLGGLEIEINLPKIYQVEESLDNLSKPKLDKWVLKPDKGAASRGVYPISTKNGKLFDNFTKKFTTWGNIINEARRLQGFKPPFFIEEYIGDNIPYNWEFYCFRGEVGLVRQRENTDRVSKLYKFWDTQFNDLGLIEEAKRNILKPSLPMPHNPDELLRTAKVISKNIPFIFCRIDLYDTPERVYFGELTMHPGIGNQFIDEWDKKLGKMWLRAEASL